MDAFETDVSLESEIGSCMQRTIKNLNGKGFEEEVTAIIGSAQSGTHFELMFSRVRLIMNRDKLMFFLNACFISQVIRTVYIL